MNLKPYKSPKFCIKLQVKVIDIDIGINFVYKLHWIIFPTIFLYLVFINRAHLNNIEGCSVVFYYLQFFSFFFQTIFFT